MKKKIIEFIDSNEDVKIAFDPPIPASKMVPEWYKKMKKFSGDKMVLSDNGTANLTIKSCMPVFDMTTAGYYLTLPADVLFNKENGSYKTTWSTDLIHMIENHGNQQYEHLRLEPEYYPLAFKFVQPWIVKTPPGYSCLIIHPTYRDDLPFTIFPAIVDTDSHPLPINLPFLLRDGFEGILEAGTPIAQIIPFKRDEWKVEYGVDKNALGKKNWQRAQRKIYNRNKTFHRTIKVWS
jgi:hypothetical protein